ncbi:hypothetical protein VPH35_038531 [Triticum aestivum]
MTPYARKIDVAKVHRLPDGAVIPASGRRARHYAAALERRSRSCDVACRARSEDNRGRSPPPSPRTTSCDIIELRPCSAILDWQRRVAPCLGLQVSPDAPPGWVGHSSRQQSSSPTPPSPSTPLHLPASVTEPNNDLVVVSATSAAIHDAPQALGDPVGTPLFMPRPPFARRKTLARVTGLHLIRSNPRLQAENRDMPIALLAERQLCQRMGVVEEGEMVTEAAISKFVALFRGQLSDIAVAALHALFRLDCDLASAVEDALIDHSGDAGPEIQGQGGEDATASA